MSRFFYIFVNAVCNCFTYFIRLALKYGKVACIIEKSYFKITAGNGRFAESYKFRLTAD